MQARSLGKITVPAPGTPVRLTADPALTCARIRIQDVIGQTGRLFLGVAGMDKSTGAGLIKEFWPTGGGGGIADEITLDSPDGTNALRLADYYIDANIAGEGVIVSYWVR